MDSQQELHKVNFQFNKHWVLLDTINPHQPFFGGYHQLNLLGNFSLYLRFIYSEVLGRKIKSVSSPLIL